MVEEMQWKDVSKTGGTKHEGNDDGNKWALKMGRSGKSSNP